MPFELENYTVIIQGPPPNGSVDQLLKILKYYSPSHTVVYTSISHELKKQIQHQLPMINCRIIDDVGPNPGAFTKKLNINRFISGIRSSLKEVKTEKAIVLRSDIVLDISALIESYEKSEKRIGVSSVTTKFFGIRRKWINHVCDWYYIGATEDLKLLIDCPKYPDDLETAPSSSFPISPEKFLWQNYCKKINRFSEDGFVAMRSLLKLAHISHPNEISLRCIKNEYKEIPFGINRKEGITLEQKKINTWVYKNSLFFKIYSLYLLLSSKLND
jgi:hypothetical protein